MTDPAYLAALLEAWLPARRWYATKNLAPRIESVVVAPAHGSRARRLADAGTEILEVFVTDRPARDRIVYQVPLVRRRERPDVPESAVLGREREGGWLIDAPWDSEYMIWLAGADEGGIDITETRVVTGEQSNTSVICEVTEGPFDIIIKIFRVLAEGSNPDAELQQALTRAGVRRVPRFVDAGWGSWTRGHSSEYGHLSVTSEYIDDADDAWGLATTAAAEGADIDAHGLGRAVAEVHTALARIFPTHPADDGVRRALVGTWMSRAGAAVLTVPRLAEYRAQVSAAFDDALVSPWPALQRIHGDLHLGQVMSSPTRGWVLLDFEGEPLRPLAERRRNDVAIRDVAGMLRSFDYAAGPEPGAPRLEWTTRQRDAFLDGYAELAGDPREYSELLTAMELDKAFYEARYEAGNRPDWLPIPLRGIERLVR